jgi:hypothetical protein
MNKFSKCKILNSLSGYDYLIWREREWIPYMMSLGVFELITLGTHEGKSLSDLPIVKREYLAMDLLNKHLKDEFKATEDLLTRLVTENTWLCYYFYPTGPQNIPPALVPTELQIANISRDVPGWDSDINVTRTNYTMHPDPKYRRSLLDPSLIHNDPTVRTQPLTMFDIPNTARLFFRVWQELNYIRENDIDRKILSIKENLSENIKSNKSNKQIDDLVWEQFKSIYVSPHLYHELNTTIDQKNADYETKKSKILEPTAKCMTAFQKLGPQLSSIYQSFLDTERPNFLAAYNAINNYFALNAVNEISNIQEKVKSFKLKKGVELSAHLHEFKVLATFWLDTKQLHHQQVVNPLNWKSYVLNKALTDANLGEASDKELKEMFPHHDNPILLLEEERVELFTNTFISDKLDDSDRFRDPVNDLNKKSKEKRTMIRFMSLLEACKNTKSQQEKLDHEKAELLSKKRTFTPPINADINLLQSTDDRPMSKNAKKKAKRAATAAAALDSLNLTNPSVTKSEKGGVVDTNSKTNSKDVHCDYCQSKPEYQRSAYTHSDGNCKRNPNSLKYDKNWCRPPEKGTKGSSDKGTKRPLNSSATELEVKKLRKEVKALYAARVTKRHNTSSSDASTESGEEK